MAGKLWWPYQASIEDATNAASAFQSRLAERGWLTERFPVRPFQIGITDLTFDSAHWHDVNEFLQIERDPTAGKTQARLAILMLLAQASKWHTGLRPESRWMDIPRVLAVPARDGAFRHILLGRLAGVPGLTGAAGLPLTLVVAEHEALPEPSGIVGRGKVWGAAMGGDSSKWIQPQFWKRTRQSPAFAKLIWAAPAERKAWLASPQVKDDPKAQGLRIIEAKTAAEREAAKEIGAVWAPALNRWVIGEFWDTWPSQDWIRGAETRAAKLPFWRRPGQGQDASQKYNNWKKRTAETEAPAPTEAPDETNSQSQ